MVSDMQQSPPDRLEGGAEGTLCGCAANNLYERDVSVNVLFSLNTDFLYLYFWNIPNIHKTTNMYCEFTFLM